jgi:hypothetical protein
MTAAPSTGIFDAVQVTGPLADSLTSVKNFDTMPLLISAIMGGSHASTYSSKDLYTSGSFARLVTGGCSYTSSTLFGDALIAASCSTFQSSKRSASRSSGFTAATFVCAAFPRDFDVFGFGALFGRSPAFELSLLLLLGPCISLFDTKPTLELNKVKVSGHRLLNTGHWRLVPCCCGEL